MSTRWEGRTSFVILVKRLKYDHKCSITSPSDSPIPLHRRGLYTAYKIIIISVLHNNYRLIPDMKHYGRKRETKEGQTSCSPANNHTSLLDALLECKLHHT